MKPAPPGPNGVARPAQVLVLFACDWDDVAFAAPRPGLALRRDGFDVFSFPSRLRALGFDFERAAARLAARHRDVAGVVSHHEFYGALLAALVAERLGLPGARPAAVLACQHKVHAREVLQQVAPEHNLSWVELPGDADRLGFPVIVKPLRSTYSILAHRAADAAALHAATRDRPWDRWLLRRLVGPFARTASRHLARPTRPLQRIAERCCDWPQHNLDGYMERGRAHLLGVADALFYPGTAAFAQFAYPSRLPAEHQQRALQVAARFLGAIGFAHGCFNMEFFCEPRTGDLRVLEFNPRLGSQLADLQARVDGRDAHGISLHLAIGNEAAAAPARAPRGGAAASFVFRTFDGSVPALRPGGAARLRDRFPDALLLRYRLSRGDRRRELRWLQSHRYGILHLHGDDEQDLWRRYLEACDLLGWPAQPRPRR